MGDAGLGGRGLRRAYGVEFAATPKSGKIPAILRDGEMVSQRTLNPLF